MIKHQRKNDKTKPVVQKTKGQSDQTLFIPWKMAVNIKRRIHYHLTKQPVPFPTLFQVQTNNLCNGVCIMCPIAQQKNTKPGKMTDEVFEKIIKEITEHTTKDTFLWLHLQNEPLTDPTVFDKIRRVQKISNGTLRTGLVTNGMLLTEEKIKELNTTNLDRICFSIDAATEKTYQHIRKGLDYHTVLKNIENLRSSKTHVKIFVRFIWQKDNYPELNAFKKYWKNKGIAREIGMVNNRAGAVSHFEDITLTSRSIPFQYRLIQNMLLLLTGGCYHLSNSFNILYNGDVIMCCNDYHKKTILGNVQRNSIKEIWVSKGYQMIREALFQKDFGKNPECRSCSLIQYS